MPLSGDSGPLNGFIDLHSHTTESDGTLTPAELVFLAKRIGLAALAITDHDTFAGYEKAEPIAAAAGLDMLRGIELNSRLNPAIDSDQRHVHVLAYFPSGAPLQKFNAWLTGEQEDRRTRNRRLVEALQNRGIDITLEEVEARGRSMAGRPHFARILVEKGYAANSDDAFQRYIGETAPTYVERESQTTEEAIEIVRAGGGIPVVAHPVRLSLPHPHRAAGAPAFERCGLARIGSLSFRAFAEVASPLSPVGRRIEVAPDGRVRFSRRSKTRRQTWNRIEEQYPRAARILGSHESILSALGISPLRDVSASRP